MPSQMPPIIHPGKGQQPRRKKGVPSTIKTISPALNIAGPLARISDRGTFYFTLLLQSHSDLLKKR